MTTLSLVMIVCLYLCAGLDEGHGNQGSPLPEDRIFRVLMRDNQLQRNLGRPSETAVDINFSISLIRIAEFKDQKLTLDVWVKMFWNDPRWSWDARISQRTSSISIPGEELWRPDIYLYNGIGDGMTYKDDKRVILSSDGSVTWIFPAKLESFCDDTPLNSGQNVNCELKFGSWSYNGWQLNLTHTDDGLALHDYYPSNKFEIIRLTSSLDTAFYPCCPEPYPTVKYNIVLKKSNSV